jgi:hypothetical protein
MCSIHLCQIGRSADSAIDLVVVETVEGADGKRAYRSNSTVSRYACRIQCERSPPYSARLFAAAFDTGGKIKLSVSWADLIDIILDCAKCHSLEKMPCSPPLFFPHIHCNMHAHMPVHGSVLAEQVGGV